MKSLSWRCSDSGLGKRKDTEPCRSQFAEEEEEEEEEEQKEEEEVEAATSEIKDAATEYEDAAAEYEDDVSKNECRACLQVGHWTYLCPCMSRAPKGLEEVGSGYRLVCYHCGDDDFHSNKLRSCVTCGTSLKRVCGLFCGICRANDHLSRDCLYKGMVDLTSNCDFYVCAEE